MEDMWFYFQIIIAGVFGIASSKKKNNCTVSILMNIKNKEPIENCKSGRLRNQIYIFSSKACSPLSYLYMKYLVKKNN